MAGKSDEQAAVEQWFALHGAACQAAGIAFVERAGLGAPVNHSTRAYVDDLARVLRAYGDADVAKLTAVAAVRNCQRTGDYSGTVNSR